MRLSNPLALVALVSRRPRTSLPLLRDAVYELDIPKLRGFFSWSNERQKPLTSFSTCKNECEFLLFLILLVFFNFQCFPNFELSKFIQILMLMLIYMNVLLRHFRKRSF